jgi:pimeloyl-ACP methyl ester carboxylesterase
MASQWGQGKIAGGGFTAWTLRALLRVEPTDEELRHWTHVHPAPQHRRSLQMLPRELLNRPWLEQLERDVRERLGNCPALLFHGGPGEWLLGRPTARFARMFPRHNIVPLGRAGHYFQEDTPEPVAKAVLDFARDPVAVTP